MELPINYETSNWKKRRDARNQYILEQDNKCYYCKEHIYKDPPKFITDKKINWSLFPPYFLINSIHLHHNHKTQMTIGAVHAYCNAVLWQYEGE